MVDFNKRTTSSFGLSIGTGLMLETLTEPTMPRYDPDRKIPLRIKSGDFQGYFINISTLARNIISSFSIKVNPVYILKSKGFIKTLVDEIEIISSLCVNMKLPCVFYYHDYERILKVYNPENIIKFTQPIMLNREIYGVIKKILFLKETFNIQYLFNLTGLPRNKDKKNKILLTTHIPLDLCHPDEFFLLESHTGVIVTKENFYKKYNSIGSREMSSFPMCESLLYLIGDKNLSMIKSSSIRFLLHDLAIEKKWNYLTSESKVKEVIRKHKELLDLYKEFKPIY